MHNAIRPNKQHTFNMPSTKYLQLKQKTASKRKPSLPYLAAIEKTIPHIENQ